MKEKYTSEHELVGKFCFYIEKGETYPALVFGARKDENGKTRLGMIYQRSQDPYRSSLRFSEIEEEFKSIVPLDIETEIGRRAKESILKALVEKALKDY
jgi:hypothetical protein